MLNQTLIFVALLFCVLNLNAQKESTIKLKIEPGFIVLSDSENLGLFFNVEPKLKVSKNAFIGLRLGATVNSQTIENNDSFQFILDEESDNGAISFVPTFDYYFNENNYSPYLGLGIGYYFLATYLDVSRAIVINPDEDIFEVSVDKQIGFLLRGGFEVGKLIIGLEYNFIPKSDIEIPNGQIIGTVDNSYMGVSIGFVIGAGKKSI